MKLQWRLCALILLFQLVSTMIMIQLWMKEQPYSTVDIHNTKSPTPSTTTAPKPTDTVLQTIDLLEDISKKLSEHRQILLSNANMKSDVNISEIYNRTVSAVEDDYFGLVTDIDGVSLHTYEVPISLYERTIDYPFYDYASNNCTFTELHTASIRTGQYEGKRLLDSHCTHSLNDLHPKSLPPKLLELGLPPRSLHRLGTNSLPLSYVSVYRNAIVNEDGDVYMANYRFIPFRCQPERELREMKGKEVMPVKYREVFSVAQRWGHAIYHTLAENIVRLAPYLYFLIENPSIKIQVYDNTTYTVTLLESLGINKARLIKGKVKADILYQPPGTPCMLGALQSTWALNRHFTKLLRKDRLRNVTNAPNVPNFHESVTAESNADVLQTRNNVVLIHRSEDDPNGRYFANHKAILKMLKIIAAPYGSEVLVYSDKDLPDLATTQRMYYDAFLVVGPHGAGFGNLFFAQPGTFVVEGLCWKENVRGGNLCFRNLANMLGMRYYGHFRRDLNCLKTTPEDLRDAIATAFKSHYGGIKPGC